MISSAVRIAIVGGGFSGIMVLANLVRECTTTIQIDLFESSESFASGVAYGTGDIVHLLNVRSHSMGAFSGDPQGFYDWLGSISGQTQTEQLCPDHALPADGFAPRKLYAAYIRHILQEALGLAEKKSISVRLHHHADAIDAEAVNPLLLSVKKNERVEKYPCDALVLATGNLPPRRFAFEQQLRHMQHYVDDIWNPRPDSMLHRVATLPPDSRIVIIGTGLTAIDAILTLNKGGYRGTITAISRHGHTPCAHTSPTSSYPSWPWIAKPNLAPTTVYGMLCELRQEIRKAALRGYDWRSVIDSLRPITQPLWKRLGLQEKQRFMHRLFTFWNIHRHRMAPDIAEHILHMQKKGLLRIIAGKIMHLTDTQHGIEVRYHVQNPARQETMDCALVINCTGPQYNLADSPHILLRQLFKRGLIRSHPLGIGMEITESGYAKGCAAIYPIGTPVIGELLECTAVPELRDQAYHIAKRILQIVE